MNSFNPHQAITIVGVGPAGSVLRVTLIVVERRSNGVQARHRTCTAT